MKAIILTICLVSGFAAQADKIFVKGKPSGEITKYAALRALIVSQNKDVVYECTQKIVDETKATLKNK